MTWLALIEVIVLVVQSGVPKWLLEKLKTWLHKGSKEIGQVADYKTPEDAIDALFHRTVRRQPIRSRLRRMVLRIVWRIVKKRIVEIWQNAQGVKVEIPKVEGEEYDELRDAAESILPD